MADTSLPELLGRAIGRHLPDARIAAGLALTIAALATLSLSLPDALAPTRYRTVRHESTAPPGSIACFTETDDGIRITPPSGDPAQRCFDPHILDHDVKIDMNHADRRTGRLRALTSSTALILSSRLCRPLWKQRHPTTHRLRTAIAAACLSPLAAITILAAAWLLDWTDSTLK